MSAAVILILSASAEAPAQFAQAIREQRLRVVQQTSLTDAAIMDAAGLITTTHLDQLDFAARGDALSRFLARGGRMAFMGHLVRPFLPELMAFVPLASQRRVDFALSALGEHPVFAGIDRRSLETRRGVAGFYGRGHMPPPRGAVALTGLGPQRVPVDWIWDRPDGGEIFAHAGNELWGIADLPDTNHLFAERLVDWCAARIHAPEAARR